MRTRLPFEDVPLEFEMQTLIPEAVKLTHPDAVEKGIELPLRFVPHKGENRRMRRAAVAQWQPPKQDQPSSGAVGAGEAEPGTRPGVDASPATPAMPTRRELWLQRQKHRRCKLDCELRRLQRKALSK